MTSDSWSDVTQMRTSGTAVRSAWSLNRAVVYLENMTSNLYVEREAEVFRYTLAFDRLVSLALGADESVSLISGLADAL